MGLYDDITDAVSAEFDSSLSDAVKVVTITEFGPPVYNATTGKNAPLETDHVSRGVVSFIEGDTLDEALPVNILKILILDDEKKVSEFKTGMRILVAGDTQTYKLSKVKTDPANVSHSLLCRRWA